MASLLLVADEPTLGHLVAALDGSHDLEVAPTLSAARLALGRGRFGAILLDVDQPDGEGMQLIAELRADRCTARVPLLVVTARNDVTSIVLGFAVGCDDWLPHTVHPLELRARVEGRLRAHHEHEDLALPGLHVDLSTQRAWLTDGSTAPRAMPLTAMELKLLVHFAHHVDHVIDREQLLSAVWGHDVSVLDRTVDTHVSHLRRKLAPSPWTIEAVPRLGYRFTHAHGEPPAANG